MNTMNELHGEALVVDTMYDPYNGVRVDDILLAQDIALAYDASFTDEWKEERTLYLAKAEREEREYTERSMAEEKWYLENSV
tara:strand:- start:379 stop:624 length:246 start_codon:yes stop_codon:yes gene_type:complete